MWIIDINIKEIRSEQICTGKICKTYVKSCPPPATEEEDFDAAAVALPEYMYIYIYIFYAIHIYIYSRSKYCS